MKDDFPKKINRCLLFLFFLCTMIWLFTGCSQKWSGVIQQMQTKGHYIKVGDHQVFYREEGSGPKMILIHGYGSNTVSWEKIMPALVKDYHVFALDLIGFGLSDKPRNSDKYQPEWMVPFVFDFMDSVGIEKATLVGNSMGGAIAIGCGVIKPERVDKLILIDPAAYPIELPLLLRILKTPIIGDVGSFFTYRWIISAELKTAYYDSKKLSDDLIDSYCAPMKMKNSLYGPIHFLRYYDRLQKTGKIDELIEYYQRVSQPTLIIWGENDAWVPLAHGRRLKETIKDARLVVIPECNHMPQEEKPSETIRAIREFMDPKEER